MYCCAEKCHVLPDGYARQNAWGHLQVTISPFTYLVLPHIMIAYEWPLTFSQIFLLQVNTPLQLSLSLPSSLCNIAFQTSSDNPNAVKESNKTDGYISGAMATLSYYNLNATNWIGNAWPCNMNAGQVVRYDDVDIFGLPLVVGYNTDKRNKQPQSRALFYPPAPT